MTKNSLIKINFIPLLIGVGLFILLIVQSNKFTSEYGSEFRLANIFQEG